MREADWRYLLPPPEGGIFDRMVVVGGSPVVSEVLTSARVAREVVESAGPGGADAVVVLGEAHLETSEAEAASMLRPGGILYYEVDRTRRGSANRGPKRVTRKLRDAGAEVIASYWVRPTLAMRQLFVPLDSPEALRWFQRSGFPRETFPQRAKSLGFGALLMLGGGAASTLARRFALVARKGGGGASVTSILSDASIPLEMAAAGTRVALVARGQRRDVGKLVILPFVRGSAGPAAVLKLVRGEGVRDVVKIEEARLTAIREMLDDDLRQSIPEARGKVRAGQAVISVESFLAGEPLLTLNRSWGVSRGRKIERLRLAADWITRFGFQTRVGDPVWTEERHQMYVEAPFARYAGMFSLEPGEDRLIERVSGRSRSLIGTPVPIVWNHGDYAPWNVVLRGKRISVFDWEDASEGLPLIDLLNFSRIWYKGVRPTAENEGRVKEVRALLGLPGSDPVVAAMDGVICDYLERLGIDPGYRAVAVTVPWTVRTVDTAIRAQVFGDGPELTESRRRVVRALAQYQDELLGGDRSGDMVLR